MKIIRTIAVMVLATLCISAGSAVAQQRNDEYASMLSYLATRSELGGHALSGAQGAIAVNQAAGDGNLQANLHSFASGVRASTNVDARQWQRGNAMGGVLADMTSVISGGALAGASGIASINQASGSANMELNSITATLAAQGIREASDEAMASSAAVASAGEQYVVSDPRATRRVGVEATALRGFEGVLQLNQIAGSGNATENQLSISVQGTP